MGKGGKEEEKTLHIVHRKGVTVRGEGRTCVLKKAPASVKSPIFVKMNEEAI